MQQTTSTELLRRLLQEDVLHVLAWIDEVRMSRQEVPGNFNWLGLAEAAALRARSALDPAWARVAIAAYDQITGPDKPRDREAILCSSMQLRAYMIATLGPRPGDTVLDPEVVLNWFTANLPFSLDHATKVVASLRGLDEQGMRQRIDEMRQMRRLKNRTFVLKTLSSSDRIQLSQEAQSWIALWDELP